MLLCIKVTGFKLQPSGGKSDHYTNWTTTTSLSEKVLQCWHKGPEFSPCQDKKIVIPVGPDDYKMFLSLAFALLCSLVHCHQCDQIFWKSSPIFTENYTNSCQSRFYLKSAILKIAQKVSKHFGYFWNKFVSKIFKNIPMGSHWIRHPLQDGIALSNTWICGMCLWRLDLRLCEWDRSWESGPANTAKLILP